MTAKEKVARRKLSLLDLATELGTELSGDYPTCTNIATDEERAQKLPFALVNISCTMLQKVRQTE